MVRAPVLEWIHTGRPRPSKNLSHADPAAAPCSCSYSSSSSSSSSSPKKDMRVPLPPALAEEALPRLLRPLPRLLRPLAQPRPKPPTAEAAVAAAEAPWFIVVEVEGETRPHGSCWAMYTWGDAPPRADMLALRVRLWLLVL